MFGKFMAALFAAQNETIRPGRVYGPRVYTSKNVGRNLLRRARTRYMPHQGEQECARRRRQALRAELRRDWEAMRDPAIVNTL